MSISTRYCLLYFVLVEFNCLYIVRGDASALVHTAFVFAGGVRSFIFPQVFASIRSNLISSFCPVDSCVPHVFIRLSLSDNIPFGPDASGLSKPADPLSMKKVILAISLLNGTRNGSPIHVDFELKDIGSSQESVDKEREFVDIRHKIYRDLDPRRYSMYFNRYRAYKMATDYESKMSIKYSWVVHARLDAAWGEPIRPHHCWPPFIWVQDSWYSSVPDTFALVPRNFSDNYFSMDVLVTPDVMCLGGPNFAESSLSDESLTKLGFNATGKVLARAERCADKHRNFPIIHESGERNDSWSYAGVSEFQMMRRLRHMGVTRDKNNLRFVQLFMVIVRVNDDTKKMMPLCFYVDGTRMFPFLEDSPYDFHSQSWHVFSGCFFFLDDPAPAHSSLISEHRRPSSVSWQSCRADGSHVDNVWNFMPFRLKTTSMDPSSTTSQSVVPRKCLTVVETKSSSDNLFVPVNVTHCVDSYWMERELYLYSDSQMFHFHPVHKHLQPIKHIGPSATTRCLTLYTDSPQNNQMRFSAGFKKCNDVVNIRRIQRFRVFFLDRNPMIGGVDAAAVPTTAAMHN